MKSIFCSDQMSLGMGLIAGFAKGGFSEIPLWVWDLTKNPPCIPPEVEDRGEPWLIVKYICIFHKNLEKLWSDVGSNFEQVYLFYLSWWNNLFALIKIGIIIIKSREVQGVIFRNPPECKIWQKIPPRFWKKL